MREYRLIDEAIEKFELDLNNYTILTEAASGNFVWTPIIAAKARGNVYAYSKDSKYATFQEVKQNTLENAHYLGIEENIEIIDCLSSDKIRKSDIITNCGFLRPLDREKLQFANETAVISLMWETWEFRESDLDLAYCFQKKIPVLGTNESDPRLKTLEYLGPVSKKLLFESGIEVCQSFIYICGQGKFADTIYESLQHDYALCKLIDNRSNIDKGDISSLDAVIIADHKTDNSYLGEAQESWIDVRDLNDSTRIIHITGNINEDAVRTRGLRIYPENEFELGRMSVTTDYVGPRPVIDLHTAGLKVGSIMAEYRKKGLTIRETIEESCKDILCLDFSENQKKRYFQN